MEQNSATESVIGGAYGFGLGESDRNLYIGTRLRMKDALYPYIGLRTPAYQLGLNYDIINSDIRVSNRYAEAVSSPLFISLIRSGKRKGYPVSFRQLKG